MTPLANPPFGRSPPLIVATGCSSLLRSASSERTGNVDPERADAGSRRQIPMAGIRAAASVLGPISTSWRCCRNRHAGKHRDRHQDCAEAPGNKGVQKPARGGHFDPPVSKSECRHARTSWADVHVRCFTRQGICCNLSHRDRPIAHHADLPMQRVTRAARASADRPAAIRPWASHPGFTCGRAADSAGEASRRDNAPRMRHWAASSFSECCEASVATDPIRRKKRIRCNPRHTR